MQRKSGVLPHADANSGEAEAERGTLGVLPATVLADSRSKKSRNDPVWCFTICLLMFMLLVFYDTVSRCEITNCVESFCNFAAALMWFASFGRNLLYCGDVDTPWVNTSVGIEQPSVSCYLVELFAFVKLRLLHQSRWKELVEEMFNGVNKKRFESFQNEDATHFNCHKY